MGTLSLHEDGNSECCDSGPSEASVRSRRAGGGVAEVGVTEAVQSREVVSVRPRTTSKRRVDAT